MSSERAPIARCFASSRQRAARRLVQATGDRCFRQALPSSTEGDEPSLARVDPFIDRLADLPLSEWIAIGRAVLEDRQAASTRSTSSAIVDATIAHWQLDIAAWHVRDSVETVAFLARDANQALSRTDRRMFFAARRAGEDAALALLVHPCLPDEDLQVLFAPFAARDLGVAVTT